MKYGFYTGCAVTSTEQELEFSLQNVFRALSLDIETVEARGCLGNSAERVTALAHARELLLAEILDASRDIDTLAVACPSCYRGLRSVSDEYRSRLPLIIHPLELLSQEKLVDNMRARKVRELPGLRITPYYGCVFKPLGDYGMGEDDPHHMEEIFEALGIETVWFPNTTGCCGGPYHLDAPEAWEPVSKRIIESAAKWGIDIISVACSQCHSLLEGSAQSDRIVGMDDVLVMYYSQIIGFLIGLDRDALFPASANGPGPLTEKIL
jgi:heterodisulfide reductase subunit B